MKKTYKPGETATIKIRIPNRPPDFVISYKFPTGDPLEPYRIHELPIWLDEDE